MSKQDILNAFSNANLPITRVRKTDDGFFVYHPYGAEYTYFKYKLISHNKQTGRMVKEKIPVSYTVNFIDEQYTLERVIFESKRKMDYETSK